MSAPVFTELEIRLGLELYTIGIAAVRAENLRVRGEPSTVPAAEVFAALDSSQKTGWYAIARHIGQEIAKGPAS